MAPKGGEEPPAKGRRFDEAISTLLEKVGYYIPKRHADGKDFEANPPKPTTELLPPLFAPRRKTIFEAKAGKAPSLTAYAKELRRKVRRASRADRSHTYSGVIVTDDHISDSTKLAISKKYGISIWDIRTLIFLASRVWRTRQLTRLEKVGGMNRPIEIQVDASTTAQWCTRSYNQATNFICSIYYQHPFTQLDTERFAAIMKVFTRILNRYARGITNRTYASITIYSLPGYTDDLTRVNLKRILTDLSTEKIIYDEEDAKIHRFETAPWSFLLEP